LPALMRRFSLRSLKLVQTPGGPQGVKFHVEGEINPRSVGPDRDPPRPPYDPRPFTDLQLWDHADRSFKLENETSEARTERASAARAELAARIGGQATTVLIGHLSGKSPRPGRGASGEDSAGGGAGHIAARHVLGSSRLPLDVAPAVLGNTVTENWIAYRAVTNIPGCGGMAGAFSSPGAATTGIQGALDLLMQDWPAFRTNLLRTAVVQQIMPVATSGTCFIRIENQPALHLLPTWLGGPTNRKLHAGDAQATDEPPLAQQGPPAGVELRVRLSPSAPNGWFVHSAWPTLFV